MSITFGNTFERLTLIAKGNTSDEAYGFEETYDFTPGRTDAQYKVLVRDLANLRAALFPPDHQIARARLSSIGNAAKFDSLQCLVAPIAGKYPGTAQLAGLSAANTTIEGTGSFTALATALTFQSSTELAIGDAQSGAAFLLQGEGRTKSRRLFHVIPDFFHNDWKSRGVPSGVVWQDATAHVPGTYEPIDPLWWNNWKFFFNFLITNCVLIRRPGTQGIGASPGNAYAYCPIEEVIFQEVANKDVGGPFDKPVGARFRT